MLKYIREGLICALLVLALCIGTRIFILVIHADNVLVALPEQVDNRAAKIEQDLIGEIRGVRGDITGPVLSTLANQITSVRGDLSNQVTALRADITGAVLTTLDKRLASIQKDATNQLTTFNTTLADGVKPIMESAQQIDDTLPLFANCEFNADCVFNRFQGVSKAVEKTSQVIALEAPKMAASVDSIAKAGAGVAVSADRTGQEVVKAAQRFNAPQTKMQAFRGWLITIARLVSYF